MQFGMSIETVVQSYFSVISHKNIPEKDEDLL